MKPTATTSEPTAPAEPIVMMVEVPITALVYPDPSGGYGVVIPALPGCVTEGETLEEVQANIREAAEGWLEVTHEREAKKL